MTVKSIVVAGIAAKDNEELHYLTRYGYKKTNSLTLFQSALNNFQNLLP